MNVPVPSKGRIVLIRVHTSRPDGDAVMPAVVTRVRPDPRHIDVVVLDSNREEVYFKSFLIYGSGWWWPPRVGETMEVDE